MEFSRKKHLVQAFADCIEDGLEAWDDLGFPEDAVQMNLAAPSDSELLEVGYTPSSYQPPALCLRQLKGLKGGSTN
jgi:hypothetical protein